MGDRRSDEGQIFSYSAVCLSSPFVAVIICKVKRLILLRTVRFGASAVFTVAQVWSSSPFHLASPADGSQLIFAHLIGQENKGRRSFFVRDQRHEASRSEVRSRSSWQNTHTVNATKNQSSNQSGIRFASQKGPDEDHFTVIISTHESSQITFAVLITLKDHFSPSARSVMYCGEWVSFICKSVAKPLHSSSLCNFYSDSLHYVFFPDWLSI